MEKIYRVLVINPGSTSIRIAVFENERPLFEEKRECNIEELREWYKEKIIRDILRKEEINVSSLDAVVSRGGILKPLESGTYEINGEMLEDLMRPRVHHASNFGPSLAFGIAEEAKIPAFIVDPVSVDEFTPLARISGMPEIERESLSHALNMKAVARKAAQELGKTYENSNFVVVHLGGGISVSAHWQGRMIDTNDATSSGPFGPNRSGGVPSRSLVELCYSYRFTRKEMMRKIMGEGGLKAYLGTDRALEIEKRIDKDDKEALLAYSAMAYQIAKEIGAMAAVLKGELDAIILTGALARSERLVGWIKGRVGFLGRILVYPGSFEMETLALGALRVLRGEEKARIY